MSKVSGQEKTAAAVSGKMSDAEILAALAADPVFLERAAKLVSEAKKKLSAGGGKADLSSAAEAQKKLAAFAVSPFNDASKKAAEKVIEQNREALSGGALSAACKDLAGKPRTKISWVLFLLKAGHKVGERELEDLAALDMSRDKESGMGDAMMAAVCRLGKEDLHSAVKKLPKLFRLPAKSSWMSYLVAVDKRGRVDGDAWWNAVAHALKNGAAENEIVESYYDIKDELWSYALGEGPEPKNKKLVAECLREMRKQGMVNYFVGVMPDNMASVENGKRNDGADSAKLPPSYGLLSENAVQVYGKELFPLFCEWQKEEREAGLETDSLGRSRLTYANAMMWDLGKSPDKSAVAMYLSVMEVCLESGDNPEMLGRCDIRCVAASAAVADFIESRIESREVSSVSGPGRKTGSKAARSI